jgi:carbonic anhydrase/acetyltransferase-like protein (isoleucine patch superfamily)
MALFSLRGVAPDMAPSGLCYVAESAVVVGKVKIKAGASIWFGVVARGDNEWIEIGERSNVQDNSVLHTDPGYPCTIGKNCTIGHNAIIHGCTIGDNTLIGMGAILMNGAQVGSNCIIGAGALVGERKVVADGTLVVGSPARELRKTDEAAIAHIAMSADVYFNRWQVYASELTRIS